MGLNISSNAVKSRNTVVFDTCESVGEDCSIEKALHAIGGKWSFLVMRELLHGTKRFGELKRSIQGISAKSLAVTLHHLEDHIVLTRTVYPTNPPNG